MHYDHHLLIYDLPSEQGDAFAFSTTRQGGCSTGAYASMNCTPYTGDDASCVQRNQQQLCAILPQQPIELVIPYQTHGTACLAVDDTYLAASPEQKQALLQGAVLCVMRFFALSSSASAASIT